MAKMHRSWRLAVLGTVSGLLSGCILNPDARPPTEMVPSHQIYHSLLRLQPSVVRPQVETVEILHSVDFAFGSDTLSAAEVDRLAQFLREARAGDHRARIAIDGPRKAAGSFDVLTEARMAAIAEAIADRGLLSEIARRPVESLARRQDAIVVTVSRAMVIEPDCDVPKTIYGPRPTHVWSCSSAVVLGRMVVDPQDLNRGRTLAPADGQSQAMGVERYRNDKIKQIKRESTEGD